MDESVWQTTLGETGNRLLQSLMEYIPNLLGAAALLALGWILARLGKALAVKLTATGLKGLDRNRTVGEALGRTGLRHRMPQLVGGVFYWAILLIFVASAIDRLELRLATTLIASFASYVPRVALAVLIILTGFLLGNVIYGVAATAASSAGLRYAGALGRSAQILLVLFGFFVAAEQIGIGTTLLTVLLTIVVGTTLGGAALAFGLGSGLAASNIIASYYLLKTYQVGQTVKIGSVQGRILEITQTAVILDTPEGQVMVPARKFTEEVSVLVKGND